MDRKEGMKEIYKMLLQGDFAILAGIGTALTVLDLGKTSRFSAAEKMIEPATSLCVAAVVTLIALYLVLVEATAEEETNRLKFFNLGCAGVVFVLQIFSVWSVVDETGVIIAQKRAEIDQERFVEKLEIIVDDYVDYEGQLPKNRDYLMRGGWEDQIKRSLSTIRADTFGYKKKGLYKYDIQMPGPDGIVGNYDDIVYLNRVDMDENWKYLRQGVAIDSLKDFIGSFMYYYGYLPREKSSLTEKDKFEERLENLKKNVGLEMFGYERISNNVYEIRTVGSDSTIGGADDITERVELIEKCCKNNKE